MSRALFISLTSFLLTPFVAFSATFSGSQELFVTQPVEGNFYGAGSTITITSPITGDVVVAGGDLFLKGVIEEDLLASGGSIRIEEKVLSDVRAFGGRIVFANSVGGDVLAAGGIITALHPLQDSRLFGGRVEVRAGATGPVHISAGSAVLSGTFDGDVVVTVSDALTIEEGTVISGSLRYNAPQEIVLPSSVSVLGGVTYTGSAFFVPSPEEAQAFALAGATMFFFIKILSLMIIAGIVAGVFTKFSNQLGNKALFGGAKNTLLNGLLGFGVIVAAPVLALFLFASVVGFGLAFLLLAAYVLLLMIAYAYAAVLVGLLLAHTFFKKNSISWRGAIAGALTLSLIQIVPFFGGLVVLVLVSISLGTLCMLLFHFLFGERDIVV